MVKLDARAQGPEFEHSASARVPGPDVLFCHQMVVTRMDTLNLGWTHYFYYTTHLFSSVFCLIL